MGSSLSTMSAQSCLQQQRDAYPYMFHHDPLSSLASASYGRSCGAAQSAQSHMGGYGSSLASTGASQGAGEFLMGQICKKIIKKIIKKMLESVDTEWISI